MALKTLADAFYYELQDILSVEKQLVMALLLLRISFLAEVECLNNTIHVA